MPLHENAIHTPVSPPRQLGPIDDDDPGPC